ncbi:MAG TPA: coenzyme F420-0:L-glutamate ligase [Nitrososphaeraceae archaeon]|nr:coenzyme F420-0:L-glutamate ligase [Nitrososphaeraceae archaeon]
MEILPISVPVKKGEFDLFDSIILSNFKFRENDILIISSKYVSMSEGSVMNLDKVKVSKKAKSLASEYHMSAKLAELTLREADYIYKGIPGFLLAVKNGVMAPNAGIDKSNVPRGFVILCPSKPFKSAENLRRTFLVNLGIKVGVVIADSRLMPTRIGTIGIALASAGFEPVEDQRGKRDLFGNILKVTLKAVSDSLAATGVAVMGEGNESTPIAVIRGIRVIATDRKLSWHDMAVDARQDIYIRGLQS